MKIDNNELEIEAMALFKKGEGDKARELQKEFLAGVLASGTDHCPCPEPCRHHGKCKECVIIHRGHGDHLPFCFREIINKRLAELSGLSEHSFRAESEMKCSAQSTQENVTPKKTS